MVKVKCVNVMWFYVKYTEQCIDIETIAYLILYIYMPVHVHIEIFKENGLKSKIDYIDTTLFNKNNEE